MLLLADCWHAESGTAAHNFTTPCSRATQLTKIDAEAAALRRAASRTEDSQKEIARRNYPSSHAPARDCLMLSASVSNASNTPTLIFFNIFRACSLIFFHRAVHSLLVSQKTVIKHCAMCQLNRLCQDEAFDPSHLGHGLQRRLHLR